QSFVSPAAFLSGPTTTAGQPPATGRQLDPGCRPSAISPQPSATNTEDPGSRLRGDGQPPRETGGGRLHSAGRRRQLQTWARTQGEVCEGWEPNALGANSWIS